MPLKKCFICNKTTATPYSITDVTSDSKVLSYECCKACGDKLMSEALKSHQTKTEKLDLTHLQTPEQLLEFITGMQKELESVLKPPCPNCGLTAIELDKHGRFGCPKCYEHFTEIMDQLVYPYHKAKEHVGKIPKNYVQRICESNVEEKVKFLKLKLAQAIELEKFEQAAEIKRELSALQGPATSSEGQ